MTMHYDNYVVTLSRQNHVSDMYRKYQIPLHSTAHMYRKVRFIGHMVYDMYRKCHFIGHVILRWIYFSHRMQQGCIHGFCS